jgi:hypothetical protein
MWRSWIFLVQRFISFNRRAGHGFAHLPHCKTGATRHGSLSQLVPAAADIARAIRSTRYSDGPDPISAI